MKDTWERIKEPALLSTKQIDDIVQPAFPNTRVVDSERIGVGLSNSNYKIYLEGISDPFVFRLYRGNKDIANKEMSIASLVRNRVPIADFIYADTTCQLVEQPWSILEWKEGVHLWNVLKAQEPHHIASAAESVGRVLANIHAFTFDESGFFNGDLQVRNHFNMDGDRFLSAIQEYLSTNCGTWLGDQLSNMVWSFCQTYSSILTETQETPVLLHSDYNGLNILMHETETGFSTSAVLDWEDAFSWSRYADIGNMLRYEEEDSIFEQHFIQGYSKQGGILHKNWKLLSKLEDLVALCDMLNSSTANTPIRANDLKSLIARTVQQTV